jgi:hypothetical protein
MGPGTHRRDEPGRPNTEVYRERHHPGPTERDRGHPHPGGDLEDGWDPLKDFIKGALTQYKKVLGDIGTITPENAPEKLAVITEGVLGLAAGATTIDLILGATPTGEGFVSSNATRHLLSWLGVGAVLNAVAHDPVKISLLRPYQDSLEMTFRNRRPDDFALFQAYRTRELTPTKVEDLSKLDETLMDTIEKENDKIYFGEIAKWGYSEEFAGALSRSATITAPFGQLMALSRMGLLSKGLAIYSLWGAGYDRVVMRPLLEALMKANLAAAFEGFRSMIEPSYVEGFINEEDLRAYYDRINVPPEVQAWVFPRLQARRKKTLEAATRATQGKERDLTLTQVQQAYVEGLLERGAALNLVLDLGYSQEEATILMALADLRIKVPKPKALKRLTLTDYEKAYKNGLITKEVVLARMAGEYDPGDIALEGLLLDIGKA